MYPSGPISNISSAHRLNAIGLTQKGEQSSWNARHFEAHERLLQISAPQFMKPLLSDLLTLFCECLDGGFADVVACVSTAVCVSTLT